MNWDEIAACIAMVGVVVAAIWGFTRPRKALSDEDRRDFDDAGEW